jgi:Tol biopolymer transport system component
MIDRMFRLVSAALVAAVLATGCAASRMPDAAAGPHLPAVQGERHLRNIRQLTFGGENAEAYFSFDGKQLIFQSTRDGAGCDQQYTMNIDGSGLRRVSNGQGRTTCGFFLPGNREIVYASTHGGSPECPARPDMSRGYVWPVYASYDIYRADADGSNLRNITSSPGYDAEPTVGPDGRIVFTSVRDGDMEIYSMNADGSGVRRLTNRVGPDGGPFFNKDGSKIVFRGRTLTSGAELDRYKSLLKDGLWQPTSLELFVMNSDGSGLHQITSSSAASFAPFFHPDGKRIIFSSNITSQQGRGEFDLYMINVDGTGLERITHAEGFDGFPMWSPDGTKLVFASNRNAAAVGNTNLFIADWVD